MTRIQTRRDTAANWSTANTILDNSEPALETDTNRWKTGDGVTPWNLLRYDAAGAVITAQFATPAVGQGLTGAFMTTSIPAVIYPNVVYYTQITVTSTATFDAILFLENYGSTSVFGALQCVLYSSNSDGLPANIIGGIAPYQSPDTTANAGVLRTFMLPTPQILTPGVYWTGILWAAFSAAIGPQYICSVQASFPVLSDPTTIGTGNALLYCSTGSMIDNPVLAWLPGAPTPRTVIRRSA